MKELPMIRGIFVVAGLYDGLVGVAFLLAAPMLYAKLNIPPPNHWAYIHFISLLLIIFGLMFLAVAANPLRNANLILFGILLKFAYFGTVFYHWWAGGIPNLWKPFAFIDVACAVVFVWAYAVLRQKNRAAAVI